MRLIYKDGDVTVVELARDNNNIIYVVQRSLGAEYRVIVDAEDISVLGITRVPIPVVERCLADARRELV